MTRLEKLEQEVRQLYEQKDLDRDSWADWLYEFHVFLVRDEAKKLAERFDVNTELPQAAAILHDIADARMSRFDENHEKTSSEIGRSLLEKAGFSEDEISIVIDDAIRFHGCRNGVSPNTTEGKIMATADALVHLQTDFYIRGAWASYESRSLEETKKWVLWKINRDFYEKIQYDEIRQEVKPSFQSLLDVFSR